MERVWELFADVPSWPRWNPCMRWARVRGGELKVGATLIWVFNAIRPWYPYKLPAIARIVEVEPCRKVTWEVRVGGLHALHSYLFEPLDGGRCRFGSWEIAEGPGFTAVRRFWLAHFRYVCQASLDGARWLPGNEPKVRLRPFGAVDAPGPPLVAVPGIDGSPGSVAPILERLGRQRRVLLADYSKERHDSLEALAAEVAELVKWVGEPVDLLGQSIGTIVAAEVAATEGVPVRKVVLIATFTKLRWNLLRVSNMLTRLTPRPLFRLTAGPLMALVCGPVGDGRQHPFLPAVRNSHPGDAARRTAWQVGRDFAVELGRVRQPTLVLMGADDRFVPDARAEIAKLRGIFGDDAVVAIPHAGHVLLPTPAIEQAVKEIEAFLG